MVLSAFVIMLVSHAFLVQNRFYSTQTLRTAAHENVRAGTELMAREIRTAMEGGVMVAGPRTLTVRSPIAMTIVCNLAGTPNYDVFNEDGELGIDTDEVAGAARRDPSTGDWAAAYTTWGDLDGSTSGSADNCYANGADTVGARGSFHRIRISSSLLPTAPGQGDVVMVFRETTFKIQQSQLDPGALGIFRAAYGDPLVEFATGVDTTARFRYRLDGGTYVDTVSAGSLAAVDAVRVVADARRPAPTGGVDDITFGWAVTVPLRNVR